LRHFSHWHNSFFIGALQTAHVGAQAMRINPIQTPRGDLQSLENREDKQKQTTKESNLASVGRDRVILSPEMTTTRQFTTLAASDQIENTDIDRARHELIAERLASGFYSQPEIEQEIAEKVVRFPGQ
jgi:hypothetical protein